MPSGIYKALNIEENEQASVLLLISQSVFLGIFYGAFDVGAMSLFLQYFDSSTLGIAFLVSGISGIILTSVYTYLQKRISFNRLAVFNLVFVAVLTILLRSGFGMVDEKSLVFMIFILMGPLNILAVLGFWGTVGRIFSLRQGKRLFGLIDTGQIIGIIISSFAIPVLVVVGFRTRDTLLLSAMSIILAVVFQFVIERKFDLSTGGRVKTDTGQIRVNFWKLLRGKYILMMSVFVILSMLTAFFIHYSFLSVTDDQYPEPAALTQFLGLFTGSMMIFIVLIKTFVYSRLMKTYGLQLSLLLSPLLIGLFTLAAAVIGTIFGYTVATGSFLIFFLVIALSKLFSRALKDSIEAPSFKLLYQSLDQEIRYDVQARIDGTVNEIAATASGLILMILGSIGFLKLIHYSYALFLIIGAWVLVSFVLYREYRDSLRASLASFKLRIKDEGPVDGLPVITTRLVDETGDFIAARAFYRVQPERYEKFLVEHLKRGSGHILFLSAQEISSLCITSPAGEIAGILSSMQSRDEKVRQHLSILDRIERFSGDTDQPGRLARSKNIEDRLLAASLLEHTGDQESRKNLLVLLRDQSEQVVKVSIRTVSRLRYVEASPYLVDFLVAGRHLAESFDALASIGEKALEHLEQAYHKTQAGRAARIRIIMLYARIGGKRAIHLLRRKILENDPQTLCHVLTGLRKLGYRAGGEESVQVFQVLERIIGVTARHIAARASLAGQHLEGPVLQALDEEMRHDFDLIFMLLGLLYEPESVEHVRNNLESGTAEGAGFAMELLDLFVAEQIKPVLFPLLEDVSGEEKVKIMQQFFPVEMKPVDATLLSLINADYNQVSIWTKSCAISCLVENNKQFLTGDIVAQLFNPEEMVRQAAVRYIRAVDPGVLRNIGDRIGEFGSREEDLSFRRTLNSDDIPVFELVRLLGRQEWMSGVPGIQLYTLARAFTRYSGYDDRLNPDNPLHLVLGKITLRTNGSLSEIQGPKFIPVWELNMPEDAVLDLEQDAQVYYISHENWDNMLIDSALLAQKFLAMKNS